MVFKYFLAMTFLQPFLFLHKGFACPTTAGIIIHLIVVLLLPFIKGFEENHSWWQFLDCLYKMAQESNNSVRFLQENLIFVPLISCHYSN